jgi:hypothetical protein
MEFDDLADRPEGELREILAQSRSPLNFAMKFVGQYQGKLERREPLDRDDVARLYHLCEFLPELGRIARESDREDDKLVWALVASELPSVVGGLMRVYGVDPIPILDVDGSASLAAATWEHFKGAVLAGATAPMGSATAPRLVFASDIARKVGLEEKSLDRYRKDWPSPDVTPRGRNGAQWQPSRILSKLKEQFPHVDFTDWT